MPSLRRSFSISSRNAFVNRDDQRVYCLGIWLAADASAARTPMGPAVSIVLHSPAALRRTHFELLTLPSRHPWVLAERPALDLVGLEEIDNRLQFALFVRPLGATVQGIRSLHQHPVHCVGLRG